MKILLVDNGTTLKEKLEKLIPGCEEVVCFDQFSSEEAEHVDLVILSGSSLGPLYGNESAYQEEIEFIQNTQKPLIGICFGYELIVHAYGGTLKQLPEHAVGTVAIKVLEPEVFDGRDSFTAFENHRWGIDDMPDNFVVTAESEHGPEAIRHTTLPIFGFQYHPENHVDAHVADEMFVALISRCAASIS